MRSKGDTHHLFDLDRTLVYKNLSFSFYFYLIRRKIVSPLTLLRTIPLLFRYKLGMIDLEGIHRAAFRFVLKGLRLKTLEDAADRFVKDFLSRQLNVPIFQILCSAQESCEPVFLLSSSAHFLVERVSRLLGFERFAGTQYSIDSGGRLCDIETLITGPEKLILAKRWTKKGAHTIAYSDSSDDLPLFEWADVPIAVSPDRELRRVARENGWTILESALQ